MTTPDAPRLHRRAALATGAGALATLALTHGVSTAAAAPAIQSGGGIAGGGTTTLANGATAHFALFASRFVVEGQDDPLITGRVQWSQDDGHSFESTAITSYGPIPDLDQNARAIEGKAKGGDGTEIAFRIVVVDVAGPGTGQDMIQLILGDLASPSFKHDGAIATGDVQLLTFAFE